MIIERSLITEVMAPITEVMAPVGSGGQGLTVRAPTVLSSSMAARTDLSSGLTDPQMVVAVTPVFLYKENTYEII